MPALPPPDFRQHLELETPEHVILDFEIAGLGSRTLAVFIDFAWIMLAFLLGGIGTVFLPQAARTLFIVVFFFLLYSGYFTLFEALREGQTPGKRALGIRVIRDTGQGISLSDALARNLLRMIDVLGLLGAVMIAASKRGRRLGDIVAGTIVVRDRPAVDALAVAAADASAEADLGSPQLDEAEFALLREYSLRASALPAAARARIATDLALRFAAWRPARAASDEAFLAALLRDEDARRRGRFGARAGSGGRNASSAAGRLVALKSQRWAEFEELSRIVSKRGLDALSAQQLPDFAARYRELAADLARARVYRAPRGVLLRLERLVASGHSALYRARRSSWAEIWQYISHTAPSEVVASWRYVLLAWSLFTLPAAGGYLMMRARPSLAEQLVPATMLERAEAGVARRGQVAGYVEAPLGSRPALAAQIITNNIMVSFRIFAGGVLIGVGALVGVAFNGLALGSAAGHFANLGVLEYLLTFILGHGILELFAVWVAGAAGFLLGIAILVPGDLSRSDAIVVAGRRAMRLLTAVMIMLTVAGTIEGFISPSDYSLRVRAGASALSILFVILYLSWGSRPPYLNPAAPRT